MKKDLATLLTELRKKNNMTQNELAEKLGVTYQAVSKWERGENYPDSLLLLEIAKLYKVTVDELLRGEIINKKNNESIIKRKRILFITGITLLILSPITAFIYGFENYEKYGIAILLIAAVAIPMIIYATITSQNLFEQNSPKTLRQKQKEDGIYAIAAGIFLVLGLVFGLWYIAWVVFIFAYAITVFIKKSKEEK
ncbi:helix-turn-helix domain-containing protein [Candidatus Izemoplasma sp. B36]|uniref:helix-turn-helix domain-containing protein n=1 Tax=Candidatus Izemoplasma sp. B36 TaxID=3242468 RepID=UPI003555E123